MFVPVLPLPPKFFRTEASLSLGLQIFRIRFPLSDIHRIAYTSETSPPCDNKSDRHKIRQVFIPPSPSVRTLAARQRMLKSKSPLTIFQTSISSKTLYPPPSPITFWVSIGRTNQILDEYRANQSNLGWVYGEPIRTRHFGWLTRLGPWRQRETWRGFVVTPHGYPYTTSALMRFHAPP